MPATPLLEISPCARFGLTLYAIGSCLFAGMVFLFFCRVLPPRIQTLPSEVRKLIEAVLADWSRGNTSGMLFRLVQILFLCVTLLAAAKMLARAIPSVARAVRTLFRKIREKS
jgi:hypothetical protein